MAVRALRHLCHDWPGAGRNHTNTCHTRTCGGGGGAGASASGCCSWLGPLRCLCCCCCCSDDWTCSRSVLAQGLPGREGLALDGIYMCGDNHTVSHCLKLRLSTPQTTTHQIQKHINSMGINRTSQAVLSPSPHPHTNTHKHPQTHTHPEPYILEHLQGQGDPLLLDRLALALGASTTTCCCCCGVHRQVLLDICVCV